MAKTLRQSMHPRWWLFVAEVSAVVSAPPPTENHVAPTFVELKDRLHRRNHQVIADKEHAQDMDTYKHTDEDVDAHAATARHCCGHRRWRRHARSHRCRYRRARGDANTETDKTNEYRRARSCCRHTQPRTQRITNSSARYL